MTKTEPWSWVVLTAAFLSVLMTASIYYSAGVIHIGLLERYRDEDVTVVAWLGSLFSSMVGLTSVFGSIVINIFNSRTCVMLGGLLCLVGFSLSSFVDDFKLLFLTYGLIAGCGQALSYTGSMVVIGYYFKEKTGMASGIVTSASGLSTFLFPILTQFLLETYALPGTFLMLGAVAFHSVVFGALMRPTEYEERKKRHCCNMDKRKDVAINNTKEKLSFQDRFSGTLNLFKTISFQFLFIGSLAAGAAVSIVFIFLPDYFKYTGSSPQETAFIFSLVGISGTLSRIFLGMLSSSTDPVLLYGGMYGIAGLITILLKVFTYSPAGKMAYTTMFGLYAGALWTVQHAVLVEIAGFNNLSTAYGSNQFALGVGTIVGPPIVGMMAEHLRSEYFKFASAGALFIFACIMSFVIRMVKKHEDHVLICEATISPDDDHESTTNNLVQIVNGLVENECDLCESESLMNETKIASKL